MGMFSKTVMALALVSAVGAFAEKAQASAFSAWEVSGVAWGDTLNVRKFPAAHSQKQAAYPNGTVLSLTGRCTDGLNLASIAHLPDWKQKQAVRYRWCEVWHDPARDGNYASGWVYGRYIAPY